MKEIVDLLRFTTNEYIDCNYNVIGVDPSIHKKNRALEAPYNAILGVVKTFLCPNIIRY